MLENTDERTEPATPRRRAEAREQGQVARSQDLGAAVVLLAGLLVLNYSGGPLMRRLVEVIRYCLDGGDVPLPRVEQMGGIGLRVMTMAGYAVVPLLVGVFLAAVLVQAAQVGWSPTLKPLTPNINKLNPVAGLRRLFSARSMMQLLMNVLKMVVVAGIAYVTLRDRYALVVSAAGLHHWAILGLIGELLFTLTVRLALVLLVLGIADYLYQRHRLEKDLRMTREEVKEEYRSMEGDPQVKQRRRKVQIAMTAQRIRSAVPKADVVVTNPTELAVALRYDEQSMAAPRVVAKGRDFMAAQIRKIAIEHGIPIVERRPLAQALYREVEVGQEVPPQFYRAVAEILAYVYELTGKVRRKAEAGAVPA